MAVLGYEGKVWVWVWFRSSASPRGGVVKNARGSAPSLGFDDDGSIRSSFGRGSRGRTWSSALYVRAAGRRRGAKARCLDTGRGSLMETTCGCRAWAEVCVQVDGVRASPASHRGSPAASLGVGVGEVHDPGRGSAVNGSVNGTVWEVSGYASPSYE